MVGPLSGKGGVVKGRPPREHVKKLSFNRKYFEKSFLMDTLAKMSQNSFAYSFVSEHSKRFFKIFKYTMVATNVI